MPNWRKWWKKRKRPSGDLWVTVPTGRLRITTSVVDRRIIVPTAVRDTPAVIDFPRFSAYSIGGGVYTPTNSDGKTLAERIAVWAKCHVVILGMWRGWSYSGENMQTICGTVKGQSSLAQQYIVKYDDFPTYATGEGTTTHSHPEKKMFAETGPGGDWHARDTGGGFTAIENYPNSYLINHSQYVTVDANGYTPATWKGLFITADDGDSTEDWARNIDGYSYSIGLGIKPSYDWDGVWFDNCTWRGFVMSANAPDIDGDTNAEARDNPKTIAMYAKMFSEGTAAILSRFPNFLIGGNQTENVQVGEGWDVHGVLPSNGQTFPQTSRASNVNLIEMAMGETWSRETWSTWHHMMRDYKNGIHYSTLDTSYCLFMCGCQALGSGGSRPTSISVEEWVRYGLSSCLQDDGYFCAPSSSNYASEQWIADMDYNLGQPISTPDYNSSPSTYDSGYNAKTQGIHWREYDNGIAIVNPKDNGDKTGVTLPNPGANKVWQTFAGATVTTFNLQQRHGLILKRVAI